jgi:hypothetical protein
VLKERIVVVDQGIPIGSVDSSHAFDDGALEVGAGGVQYSRVIEFYRKIVGLFGGLGLTAKIVLVVVVTVGTTALAMAVVVWLPPDHFTRQASRDSFIYRHPALRWSLFVVKNLLGLAILPMGVVMALPLVPGPGLVFIVIALSLLDFPGKKHLERKLLGRPSVLKFINDVRTQFGKPPMVIETVQPGSE